MRIVIDTSPLKSGHKHRGIGMYTRHLAEAMMKHFPEHRYFMTSKSGYLEADIIHFPYFDFFFPTLPLIKTRPSVVTIHDTIPLVFPDQYKPGIKGKINLFRQKLSLSSVKAVLADSLCSKQDIVRYLKVPESKVHAVYLAAPDFFTKIQPIEVKKVLKKYKLHQPYFLYVGDINYNKNVPALIDAFTAVADTHELVLVSRALKNPIPQAQAVHERIQANGLESRVKILTSIPLDPPQEMVALYNGADWYVQPSLYEGFGLPVLEAMASETPVVSSTAGSLKEILGTAGIQFDPKVSNAMSQAMVQATHLKKSEREAFIAQGVQQTKLFSWKKTAAQTLSVYEQVLGVPR